MKRALLENVKVIPYTLGTAIDRDGFLSAIVAANITAGDSAGIEVTHCDEESGSYVAVPDDFVVLGEKNVSVSGAALVQFYLDLVGCKRDPNTERLHSGDDAVFFGGVRIGSKQITGLPSKKLCMATDDGSIYIVVGKDKINVKGDVEIEGNVDITGDVKITGKVEVTQTVTAQEDVIGAGISLKEHVHSGVQPGGGSSGQPA